MADEGIDWTGVEEPMARQILAQGEAFMQAQLQAALAADSRATTMAGLYITLALASLAAGFGYWDEGDSLSPLLSGISVGALLVFAAISAAWAARPIEFYFPGNQPHQWFPGRKNGLVGMIGGEAENYDARIAYNDGRLTENQAAIKCSFILAIAAPLAGVLGWSVPLICSSFRA